MTAKHLRCWPWEAPFSLVFLLCCALHFDQGTSSKTPLLESPQPFPASTFFDTSGLAGEYDYHGNLDLERLLDVGACTGSNDGSISYVPPLDGTSPFETLCQDNYAMKIVLFDLELVQLKSVDPVGGSFRAKIQMLLHWVDSIIPGSNGSFPSRDCKFFCKSTSSTPTCCDEVWVPPLKLPECDINNIDSSINLPYIYFPPMNNKISFEECSLPKNKGLCIWRRFWYLTIDATCVSNMNFRNFPFDIQDLKIELLNPYASRTWFQLTKGFLKKNIDESINGINLSPDYKIPGWYVSDILVSCTCGTTQSWLQTFLVQDKLLTAMSNKDDVMRAYASQHTLIDEQLDPKSLTCSMMEDFDMSKDDENITSPTDLMPYQIALTKYKERVQSTLAKYRQCTQDNGASFSWSSVTLHDNEALVNISYFNEFNASIENIQRSFSFLDLHKDDKPYKLSFPCLIATIANLTTPSIQVTIQIQRYKKFYFIKMIVPTIACVAFTFSAFGLQAHDLLGRLTVVVPSVIALTAVQGFVVSGDIPPVAYIAPTTYIILISYATQVFIAFESIFVKWLVTQKRPKFFQQTNTRSGENAASVHEESDGVFLELHKNVESKCYSMSSTRFFDLSFMAILILLYCIAILTCTLWPWHRSQLGKAQDSLGLISIWNVFPN